MIENKLVSNSEEDTIYLGEEFAEKLKPGDIVAFYGDLGSGKTEFIKGICNRLEVEEIVNSPTFTIVNEYNTNLLGFDKIFHIDLYRIKDVKELTQIGFADILHQEHSLKLIEWSENANELLEDIADYKVIISIGSQEDRQISILELGN